MPIKWALTLTLHQPQRTKDQFVLAEDMLIFQNVKKKCIHTHIHTENTHNWQIFNFVRLLQQRIEIDS